MTDVTPKHKISQTLNNDTWIWVIIQTQGGADQLLGQLYPKENLSFIPAFLDKEQAKSGLELVPRDDRSEYYVQAMQLDHLAQEALQNGFHIFIVTGKGEVLEKINPL
jgi:hypothetical protein